MSHPNPNTKITNFLVSLVKIQLECNLNKLFIGGSKRLIGTWPSVAKIIHFGEKVPKSKSPSFKSYQSALSTVKDELTPAKIKFFQSFTTLFNKVPDICADIAISQYWLGRFQSETSRTHYQA